MCAPHQLTEPLTVLKRTPDQIYFQALPLPEAA